MLADPKKRRLYDEGGEQAIKEGSSGNVLTQWISVKLVVSFFQS